MEDQKPNEESEPKVQSGEIKQEAEQSPKPRRRDTSLSLSLFLKLLEVYFLFVAAIVSVGVLAFYSHHDATSKISPGVSVILVLIAPISVVWYVLIWFRKTAAEKSVSGKQQFFIRFTQSFAGRSLLFLGNNYVFTFCSFALPVYNIIKAIIRFPLEPRASLAIIVFFLALFFALLIAEAFGFFETRLRRIIIDTSDAIKATTDNVTLIVEALKYIPDTINVIQEAVTKVDAKANEALQLIADNESSYDEAHKTSIEALKAISHTVELLANGKSQAIDEPLEGYEERESD
jgi:hypothetical protein